MFTNLTTSMTTEMPLRGDWVKTPGGGEGIYVGKTSHGTHWVSYRADQYAAMCARFDARRTKKSARPKTVKLTKLTSAQWGWLDDLMSLLQEWNGSTALSETKTTCTVKYEDALYLLERLETLTEWDFEGFVNHELEPDSPQWAFSFRMVKKGAESLSKKLRRAIKA